MELGEKMKALRLQQGLTLEEVGTRIGVGKSTVRKWESGQIANMRSDKIALVAKALNTTPAYLMGWNEEENPAPEPASPEREKVAALFMALSEENKEKLMEYGHLLLMAQSAEDKPDTGNHNRE